MIILLYGEDNFRLNQKLNEIINSYKVKHQSGLDFACFREDSNLDEVKLKIESVSMFNEKKLIVLKNVFDNENLQEDFFQYAREKKLKASQNEIVTLYQEGKLAVSGFKRKVSMLEEFKPLTGNNLTIWIRNEVNRRGGAISLRAAQNLADFVGNDLWQMHNEINKLLNYQTQQEITENEVILLVGAKIDSNIFKMLDALAYQNRKNALRLLHEHLNKGDNEIYLFTMLIYQMRNLIRLKDLINNKVPIYALASKSGLHPFVVKKSTQVLNNFSLDYLKQLYRRLLTIDLQLKSGRVDGLTALDLLMINF